MLPAPYIPIQTNVQVSYCFPNQFLTHSLPTVTLSIMSTQNTMHTNSNKHHMSLHTYRIMTVSQHTFSKTCSVSRQRYMNVRKSQSYVKCWKCPPHSAMNGFTLFLISDAASWTDTVLMLKMQGSSFYFNGLYFLQVEFVHVLGQNFHCLIS
jgi:hypothetical protein